MSQEGSEALTRRASEMDVNCVGCQAALSVSLCHFVTEDRTNRSVGVDDFQIESDRFLSFKCRHASRYDFRHIQ